MYRDISTLVILIQDTKTFINKTALSSSMIDQLKELGLTENEAKLYLALLELGSTKAFPLIKKVNLYRGTVYTLLEQLIKKGLVNSVVKAKIKYFQAAEPDKLLDILKEKKDAIASQETTLKQLIPKLKLNTSKEKVNIQLYEGKSGAKTVLSLAIKERKTIYLYGSGNLKRYISYYYELWNRLRKRYKISLKIIYNKKQKQKTSSENKLPYCEIRYLPKQFETPSPTMIFGSNVAITVWAEEPSCILIKNKEIAQTYKGYFDVLWKIAKR